MIRIEYPVHLVSEANVRDNRWKKAKRVKQQRMRAWAEVLDARAGLKKGDPLKQTGVVITVRLTRIAPKLLDAHDNLPASLKATVDGIAEAWGLDDNSGLVAWEYSQEKGKPRQYAVRIEITQYIPPWEKELDKQGSMFHPLSNKPVDGFQIKEKP